MLGSAVLLPFTPLLLLLLYAQRRWRGDLALPVPTPLALFGVALGALATRIRRQTGLIVLLTVLCGTATALLVVSAVAPKTAERAAYTLTLEELAEPRD